MLHGTVTRYSSPLTFGTACGVTLDRLPILKRSYTVRRELPREEQPGVAATRTAAMAIRENAGRCRDTVGLIAYPVDGLLLLCGHWGRRVRPDLIACRVGFELGPPQPYRV